MEPFIALNFKTYKESLGQRGLNLASIACHVSQTTGVRIVVAPQFLDIRASVGLGAETFAQSATDFEPGAHTGAISIDSIKDAGCAGLLVNHAENRLPKNSIEKIILRSKKLGIESMLCTKDVEESVELARLNPTYVAIEPPELIGSGISVSSAKPEIISGAVEAVAKVSNSPVICGAGVSTGADVARAIELGAKGVLLASAYVKAKDPEKLLMEMAEALKK